MASTEYSTVTYATANNSDITPSNDTYTTTYTTHVLEQGMGPGQTATTTLLIAPPLILVFGVICNTLTLLVFSQASLRDNIAACMLKSLAVSDIVSLNMGGCTGKSNGEICNFLKNWEKIQNETFFQIGR